jgi:fatty acid desaturase
MKRSERFKPKAFAAMLVVCAAIAGIAAWATGLNFWILAVILVVAVLVNGLVATVEDTDSSNQ